MPKYEKGKMVHHCGQCKKGNKKSSQAGLCKKHHVLCTAMDGTANTQHHRPWYHDIGKTCEEEYERVFALYG